MNQFGLIIQETTAGSTLQFVSSHLDINSPEIKETIPDERTLATQLANLSNVYSVQITKNYKIYSLIVTNLTDFLGRSGFYAIRLYGPKGVNLTNFENILASINDKYISYSKSNNLNNQNYGDILSSILIVENDKKNFISLKNEVNCFYYFDEFNSLLSTVFNTKGINLVHKVYAFNKTKAVSENIAISTGLKPYSQINASQKEINIVNSHVVLKEIKINNQSIDFNPNLTDFYLLCQTNDSVLYNTTDDKNFRAISNTFVSIERKFVPKPTVKQPLYQSGGCMKKSSNSETAIYAVIIFLTIILTCTFVFYDKIDALIHPKNESGKVQPFEDNNNQNTGGEKLIEIQFELETNSKDTVYKIKSGINFEKLKKYRFKFVDGRWQYKDNKSGFLDFGKETFDKINTNNKLNWDNSQKDEFFKNLEGVSGHEVLNKTTEEAKSEDVSVKEKVTKEKAPKENTTGNSQKKTAEDPINEVGKGQI